MFDDADRYERFMGRWSRLLAPELATFAGVQRGEHLLDVGTGTGALAAHLATHNAPSRIAAIDLSANYVEIAKANHATAEIEFEVGDAMRLPFADADFDRVLSMLALNFVPDPRAALGEMRRVTRRGGTVAVAVWEYGDGMQMLRHFWDAAALVDSGAAARDERHMPCCTEAELGALWHGAGLCDIEVTGLTVAQRFADFDDFWRPFELRTGPAGALVAQLSPAQRDSLRALLRERTLGAGPDRPFGLTARAVAARGLVP